MLTGNPPRRRFFVTAPTTESRDALDERPRRRAIFRRVLLAVLITVAIAVAPAAARLIDFGVRVGEGAAVESAVAPFYLAPTPAPESAAPGTIVRQEPVVGPPEGAKAWRILYHSTDVDGKDTLVSGLVIAPAAPAADGSRTVVSWAHPTTGTAPRSAVVSYWGDGGSQRPGYCPGGAAG